MGYHSYIYTQIIGGQYKLQIQLKEKNSRKLLYVNKSIEIKSMLLNGATVLLPTEYIMI